MRAFVELLLRRRLAVVLLLLAITAGFLVPYPRAVVATNIADLFFKRDERFDRYMQRIELFRNDDTFVVVYREPEPLAPAAQARLRTAVADLRKQDDLRTVTSLLDAAELRAVTDGLAAVRYAELAATQPTRAAELTAALREDANFGGVVIARAGPYAAIVAEVRPDRSRNAESAAAIVERALDAMLAAGYERADLHPAGLSVITAAMVDEALHNLTTTLPLAAALLFAVAWFLFRQLWPVLVTLLVAGIADLWSVGLALYGDPHFNVFISLVPIVILVISFSDVVHLCSAYLLELAAGKSKHEAIVASASDVGVACLWTSLTTFIGFTALMFVPTPVMQQLGLVLGFGVGATLLIALTLVPVLLSWLPEPRLRQRPAAVRGATIGRALAWLERLSTSRPRAVAAAWSVLVVVLVAGTLQLHIDTSFTQTFAADHVIQRDQRLVRQEFYGSTFLSVDVDTGQADGLLDPSVLAQLAALEAELEALPQVARVASWVDLMAAVHAASHAGTATTRLPQTRAALAQELLIYEISGGEGLEQVIDAARQRTEMTVQLNDDHVREVYEVGLAAESAGARLLGAGATVESTGMLLMMGRWLDALVAGQRRGIGFSLLAIALVMAAGLRSWRNGLWSMVPNVLPLLVLGAVLGFPERPAHSDNLTAAMIAIGIAVDDTIHLLMRLRLEARRGLPTDEALSRAYRYTGRAMLMTSIILAVGFLPMATSDYQSFVIYGTMVPLAIVAALLADLTLLPAMVRLGWVVP